MGREDEMPARVQVVLTKRGEGYVVAVEPWSVVLHRASGPREIEWELGPELGEVLMIDFERGGHFRNLHPITTRAAGQPARSGPLLAGARPGIYKYTIRISPAPNEIVAIDPDYMIEED